APRGEAAPLRQGKLARVGDRLDRRPEVCGPLLVEAARQRGEALLAQHLADRRRAKHDPALLESRRDLVDRVVLFAQPDDEVARLGLLRLRLRPGLRGGEELRLRVAAERVAENAERTGRVAEGPGDGLGRPRLEEVGAEGFVLPVARVRRMRKEAATRC